jgi:uncharacterized membrane protein
MQTQFGHNGQWTYNVLTICISIIFFIKTTIYINYRKVKKKPKTVYFNQIS